MKHTLNGQVIATFGRHLIVRAAGGEELRARPFGRDLDVVCGDEVRCRIDARHGAEAVVANLTQLLVVLAPLPVPDLFVVDRYLAAATAAGVPATLVVNKSELGIAATLGTELAAYAAAGYGALACSAATGAGIAALAAALVPRAVAALVGQSGVGKSSLVRRLVPQAEVEIGALVRAAEGRHTTTAARLFDVPQGAALIDSPGVRDFAPAVAALDERSLGFPEVAQLSGACRFGDCRHMREPGCAVRAAAEGGALHARRYESYRRLHRLRERLAGARR
jgi:ribosome biogenesis GTPase / thiamine phosphate phosphatase